MKRLTVAAVLSFVAGLAVQAGEKKPEQPGPKPPDAPRPPEVVRPAEPAPEQLDKDKDARFAQWKAALDREVSFEFVDTPLHEALKFIGTLAGITIIAPDVEDGQTLSLKVANAPVLKALEAIARLNGFVVEHDPPFVYLVAPSEREIGEIEVTTEFFTMTLTLTEDDIPRHLRREIVERAVRAMQREADGAAFRQKAAFQRFAPDAFDGVVPEEMRERMKKAMENLPPEVREKMEKRRQERLGRERGDDKPAEQAVF
jgi:hypothetical protein